MKLSLALFAAALLIAGAAHAETPAPDVGAASDAKPAAPKRPSGVASVVDRPLRLNGAQGELRLAKVGKGKSLRIDKLTLRGEAISDPQQKCDISIVGDAPIEAAGQGTPAGEPHYAADIQVCPIAFDVVDNAVLVPAQTTACVFRAADCQANPGGLWGPNPIELVEIGKGAARERSKAESSISASLKSLKKLNKDDAAKLDGDENDFVIRRDETCRLYADESTHDFCHTRLTQARAAELRKRLSDAKKDSAASDE